MTRLDKPRRMSVLPVRDFFAAKTETKSMRPYLRFLIPAQANCAHVRRNDGKELLRLLFGQFGEEALG